MVQGDFKQYNATAILLKEKKAKERGQNHNDIHDEGIVADRT